VNVNRKARLVATARKGVPFFVLCLLVVGLTSSTAARSGDLPAGCTTGSLTNAFGTQLTLVCVPQPGQWNGTLVVYAHSYVSPETPLQLPLDELTQVMLGGTTVIGFLLGQGFAFATTSYSANGYAVQNAETDLNQLVAEASEAFPTKPVVILIGASAGGVIAVQQLERFPEIYDGGLAPCGPLVSMHTLLDGVVRFHHEVMYREVARDSGNLTVLPVARYGHCAFTGEEVFGAFGLLLVQMGMWPPSTLATHIESLPAPLQ